MSEGDKPEGEKKDPWQELINSANIDDILQRRSAEEILLSIRDSIQKGKARIEELEDLVDKGGSNSDTKSAFLEFMRQVDRDYSKAIWDAQEKDGFGFTTVAEMDNFKPFKVFYEEFKAQADDENSKVTPEMVKALVPYKAVLDKLYESRTHQFGHLFHSEQTRRIGKRLTYKNPITGKGKVNFEEMRKNPEKYRAFIDSIPKAWGEIVERMDLAAIAEQPAPVEETTVTEESSEQSSASEESSESVEVVEESTTPQPVPEVVPAGLEGIYAKLNAIEVTVNGAASSSADWDKRYLDLYKELLDTKATLMEGQLEIRKDVLMLAKGGYSGSAPNGPQPGTQPQAPNGNVPSHDDSQPEDLEGKVGPVAPEDSDSQPNDYGNLDELYEAAKAARNEGNYEEALNSISKLFAAGYSAKDKVFCEIATINLLTGKNIRLAEKIFGDLLTAEEGNVCEEVKLVAAHNMGYILEKSGMDAEAEQFSALEPEQDPRIAIVRLEQDSLQYGNAA